jgi:hypothetical protein
MGIEGWKEILEFAVGNPVLVGYLAYTVGLLIAVAVVKATEAGKPAQEAKIHPKRGVAINRTAQSR